MVKNAIFGVILIFCRNHELFQFVFKAVRGGEFFAEEDGISGLLAMVECGEDDVFIRGLLFFGEGGDELERVIDVLFVVRGLENLAGNLGGKGLFAAFVGAEGVFKAERVLRSGDFDEHLVVLLLLVEIATACRKASQ